MSTRILILSVSAGAGHVRAAQALEAAARTANPALQATHLDLLALVPKEFRKLYAEQYIKLVDKLPQLWSFLYAKSDRPSRDSVLGNLKRAAEKLNTRKLQCGDRTPAAGRDPLHALPAGRALVEAEGQGARRCRHCGCR